MWVKELSGQDPFIELARFFEYISKCDDLSDKTVYPVASMNDRDFKNLMHVYMDAVLYPNIYHKKKSSNKKDGIMILKEDGQLNTMELFIMK